MQEDLQIQISQTQQNGITVIQKKKIHLLRDDTFSKFLAKINKEFKDFSKQNYFVYLPQGIELMQDNFKGIVEHLWKSSKKPAKLHFQRLIDNQEWNLGQKRVDQGGDFGEQPEERRFDQKPKKDVVKMDATKITLDGSACDQRLVLTSHDSPLLEALDIVKTKPKKSTADLAQIKNKVETAIMNKL